MAHSMTASFLQVRLRCVSVYEQVHSSVAVTEPLAMSVQFGANYRCCCCCCSSWVVFRCLTTSIMALVQLRITSIEQLWWAQWAVFTGAAAVALINRPYRPFPMCVFAHECHLAANGQLNALILGLLPSCWEFGLQSFPRLKIVLTSIAVVVLTVISVSTSNLADLLLSGCVSLSLNASLLISLLPVPCTSIDCTCTNQEGTNTH